MLADRFRGRKKLVQRFGGLLRAAEAWLAESDEPEDENLDDDQDEDQDEHDNAGDYYDEADDGYEDDEEESAGEDSDEELDQDDDGEPIDERVLAAFEQDPILSQRAIEIDEPEPATIVLAGRVPSEYDAEHAVTIARGVPGVEHVENRLRVRRARPHAAPGAPTGA
ncbi:MAG TPA: BON domain-containing protein [Gemmatimonadaceae bacterium]|nr:BON domain-containing protein [Gemmatimonadaceae bacterium]